MNLQLSRYRIDQSGAFGELYQENGDLLCYSLEHSYLFEHEWHPKVNPGTYKCVRGVHTLKSGNNIETFEIEDVPGHDGILFHRGNTEENSEGCILLGSSSRNNTLFGSTKAFDKFMALQSGVQEFTLIVEDETIT